MNLEAYRIFSDINGNSFVAAKLEGGKVKVLAHCLWKDVALEAILEDAGLKVRTVEDAFPTRGPIFEPKPEHWNV